MLAFSTIFPAMTLFFADCGHSGPDSKNPIAASHGGTANKPSWAEVVAWTHAWDLRDAATYEDDGALWSLPPAVRIDSVADRGSDPRPLQRDSGIWGKNLGVTAIPGPKYIPSSARFNGRPAMFTDFLGEKGVFKRVCAMLTPNADPADRATWFNPPDGHNAPYWCAILCRAPEEHTEFFGAWDANNGHIGTTATIGGALARGKKYPYWGVTTSLGFGDPWPSTDVEGSPDQTVLVIVKVDDANSFMEITWRNADGQLETRRTAFRLKSYTAKEIFLGYVHSSYLTAAGLKTGSPTEAEIETVRSWAAPWIPPTGSLPIEP